MTQEDFTNAFISMMTDLAEWRNDKEIIWENNKNITTKGYWPIEEDIPEEVITKSFSMPTYFIFYQPCPNCQFTGFAPKSWPLELIKQFKKSDVAYLSIYKIKE